MVKQILTILLLFVYSFSSIGATVKAHLCAGKVQKCFCGKSTKNKTTKKDTCCAEKITFVKKQDLHQLNELATAKQPLLLTTIPADFYTLIAVPVLEQNASPKPQSKKQLLFTSPPIYALDCLYLI
jgi:hypothetical protein